VLPRRRPRQALTAVVVAAALAACASSATSEAEFERSLSDGARTVVRTERFELTSPFDAEGTAEFVRTVDEELGVVTSLLGDPGGAPIRVHLVPGATDATRPDEAEYRSLFPSRDGKRGFAYSHSFACVYVAEPGGPPPMIQAEVGREVLRHELTHVVAKRAGLAGATWFDEGLAREVGRRKTVGGSVAEGLTLAALVHARDDARPGTVRELLAWRHSDELAPADVALRYDESQALLRFLVGRTAPGSFAERLRGVLRLSDDEIVALEPAWLGELASIDVLAQVRSGVASASRRERSDAAGLLPILAQQAAELRTRAADELALGLLADPATREGASTFLVFLRANDLRPADLDALRASAAPAVVVCGEAVRARRGEAFDIRRARQAWSDLPSDEKRSVPSAAHVLGLDPPRLPSQ
jgi:hypothetical protein